MLQSQRIGSTENVLIRSRPMSVLARLERYAHAPAGWSVVPTDLLKEALSMLSPSKTQTVTVVIPTKSYIVGVMRLASMLAVDPLVSEVIVVADGPHARASVSALGLPVTLLEVRPASGIHVMWNLAVETRKDRDSHVLFLNDDVTINEGTVRGLVEALAEEESLGLVCPNYSGQSLDGVKDVFETCRGRYTETVGLAGFAMLLRSQLANAWMFDERMTWWYGDDDLLMHVLGLGWRAAIVGSSTCADNRSWTIENDPPPSFAAVVEVDRAIFERKWGITR